VLVRLIFCKKFLLGSSKEILRKKAKSKYGPKKGHKLVKEVSSVNYDAKGIRLSMISFLNNLELKEEVCIFFRYILEIPGGT